MSAEAQKTALTTASKTYLIVSSCPQVSLITSLKTSLHNLLNITADSYFSTFWESRCCSYVCLSHHLWPRTQHHLRLNWYNVPFVCGSLNNVTFISCVTFGVAAMQQRTEGALSLQEALIIPLRDNNCIYRLRCSFSEGLFIKYHAGLENQFRVSQINLQPSSHLFPWGNRQQKHLTNVENAAELIYFSISSISNEEC